MLELTVGELGQVAIARQEPPDATVRVLNGTCQGLRRSQRKASSSANPPDHGTGLAVRVGQQHGAAGLALDHAGQVGLVVLALEDRQIGLPVTEGLAVLDLGWAVLDRAVGGQLLGI